MKLIVILPKGVGDKPLDCLRAVIECFVPEAGDEGVAVVETLRAAQMIVLADLVLADEDTVDKVEKAIDCATGRGQNADPDDMSGTA